MVPKFEEEIIHLEGGICLLAIEDDNERSLFSLLLLELKGICAYYSHAVLGKNDPEIAAFIYTGLASQFEKHTLVERKALVLECGKLVQGCWLCWISKQTLRNNRDLEDFLRHQRQTGYSRDRTRFAGSGDAAGTDERNKR
ncbi:MAG: hypothetical protein MJ014_02250 [Methanocorpusculum sp.]|nr:hypothetical protein [Methanocorpusculum sp.]